MIAEPDPGAAQSEIIDKTFLYVIDVSGSMGGDKIVQARQAADYCISHLNPDDKFNIVKFNSSATTYRGTPIQATAANVAAARDYISSLSAGGGTNINAALTTALGQFTTDTTSNIIIFITDGLASVDLNAITQANQHNARIFVFGIGTNVDKSILTQIAQQNNGVSEFLMNDEVNSRISSFYTKIKDPVIQDINISFSSGGINPADLLPLNIPDIYVGQQLIVAGRYSNPGSTSVTLSGNNVSGPVQYTYNTTLSDSAQNAFVAKIWAKMRIDALMILIYTVG
jgi:Ca-activated chloride channel family protein